MEIYDSYSYYLISRIPSIFWHLWCSISTFYQEGDLFMKKFNFEKVESVIGYHFNNGKLLKQAFFRSSFAHENGRESNEVLEFIGDEVLDLAVTRILLENYAKSNNGEEYFKSNKQEGELTKIKSQLVSTDYLAHSFDDLSIEEYIYYGKSDLNNKLTDVSSIKEDVFEAIIGAIALDSNWNMDKIIKIVKKLLHTNTFLKQSEVDTNCVGMLQERAAVLGLSAPVYSLELTRQDDSMVWRATVKIKGIKDYSVGLGFKQKDAKKCAAKKMIQILQLYQNELEAKKALQAQKNDFFSIINSLVQAGKIDKPDYEFNESHDEDGNPYWECITIIPNFKYVYYGYGSTKKEAQKESIAIALEDLK